MHEVYHEKDIIIFVSFKLRELLYTCQNQDTKLLHNFLHNNTFSQTGLRHIIAALFASQLN